jgi:hypothetical protein
VGGQIVAEVLVGLIDGDGRSYRAQDPEWTPTYGSNDTFTMVDLLTTAGAEVLGQVRQAGVGDARVDWCGGVVVEEDRP